MFDQQKELSSLKEQLNSKEKDIDTIKQNNQSTIQTFEASINDLEKYGRRNTVRISGLSFEEENQSSMAAAE
ncbi:hypothetical protein DPMN_175276 [Dreissena polymorpha]|uniref:Uncharacterized protein n=1 Tax=Dreissena polymorpha TaxID=45954 RepID=A0A9D4E7J7_DREPO|nr:hypothetical protein DPMN_175276 [Dreissena polymorpha]